jgi:hypothetical protein
VTKLLLIIAMAGALANFLSPTDPQLLIDSHPAAAPAATLDAAN